VILGTQAESSSTLGCRQEASTGAGALNAGVGVGDLALLVSLSGGRLLARTRRMNSCSSGGQVAGRRWTVRNWSSSGEFQRSYSAVWIVSF